MPILFECPCGKRLKARESIAGRPVKCPQCGRMNRVPEPEPAIDDHPPEPAENTPFVLVLDDGLTGPRSIALQDNPTDANPKSALLDPGILIEPDADDDDDNDNGDDTDNPTPNAVPLEELASTAQLDPSPKPRRARPTLSANEPPAAREPWYLGWAALVARSVMAAALALSVAVPAVLLVGGLIALVRTGDPRTLLNWHLGLFPLAASLLALWAVFAVLALFWAAPVLMLVDQSRRLRTLIARLDRARDQQDPKL